MGAPISLVCLTNEQSYEVYKGKVKRNSKPLHLLSVTAPGNTTVEAAFHVRSHLHYAELLNFQRFRDSVCRRGICLGLRFSGIYREPKSLPCHFSKKKKKTILAGRDEKEGKDDRWSKIRLCLGPDLIRGGMSFQLYYEESTRCHSSLRPVSET